MSLIKLALVIPQTKFNSFEDNIAALPVGGYATMSGGGKIIAGNMRNPLLRSMSPLHKIFDSKQNIKDLHRIGIKHELSERKYLNQYNEGKSIYERLFSNPVKADIRQGIFNIPKGRHTTLAVLGEESNNLSKLKNKNVIDRMQKMRYLTGESDIIKNITGKTYGKDLLSTVDIDKLHQSSLKQFRYHTGSKSAIGRITGMALTPFLIKNKNNDEHITGKRIGASILGGMIGAKGEKFLRTNILKLHKR